MSTVLTSCFGFSTRPDDGPKRPRIDRSMIGSPTNFQHTGHIGSNDVPNLPGVQSQMQTKGGYSESACVSHFRLVELPPASAAAHPIHPAHPPPAPPTSS